VVLVDLSIHVIHVKYATLACNVRNITLQSA